MIEELAERYGLPARSVTQLEALVEEVLTDPRAPTAVTDRRGIVRDHLADSLVALERDRVRRATTIADLGSGAGFPGLPLAIALPEARVKLVESNRGKCEFIARAIAACGLSNATAVPVRAEEWADGMGQFDLVTARALAPLPVVAEYAAPLLRPGGMLLAWRGRIDPSDQASAFLAAGELGLQMEAPFPVEPYAGITNRNLQIARKVAPTPKRFPRRAGMARKRPLGTRTSLPSDR